MLSKVRINMNKSLLSKPVKRRKIKWTMHFVAVLFKKLVSLFI